MGAPQNSSPIMLMGIWELNWPERLKSHEPSPSEKSEQTSVGCSILHGPGSSWLPQSEKYPPNPFPLSPLIKDLRDKSCFVNCQLSWIRQPATREQMKGSFSSTRGSLVYLGLKGQGKRIWGGQGSQLNGIFICRLTVVLLTQDELTKTSNDWLRDKDKITTTEHRMLHIMQDTRSFVSRVIAYIKEHKLGKGKKVNITNFCLCSMGLTD